MFSFLISVHFISGSCLIASRSPLSWLLGAARVDISVVFQILVKLLSLTVTLCCWLDFIDAIFQVRENFYAESFYHGWKLNFLKCCFCVCGNDPMTFLFYSFDKVNYTDWFQCLNADSILLKLGRPHWVTDLSFALYDLISHTFWRMLHPCL